LHGVELPAQIGQYMNLLPELIAESFRLYTAERDNPVVVRPAIPILYFGDSTAYFQSPIKVITVALNPSRAEFPEHDRFWRFPAARSLGDGHPVDAPETLIKQALDDYFRGQPYRGWFNPSFERVLNGFGVSFYGAERGTALHTEIGSPLATDPTWSKLRNRQREMLRAGGVRLWHRLVESLDPDVMVQSTAAYHLETIEFAALTPMSPLCEFTHNANGTPRRRLYLVRQQRLRLPSGKQTFLVFAAAAQKPFAKASRIDQQRIGNAIAALLDRQ
jgi:hypothetical protein